jgi:HSP20 family protein
MATISRWDPFRDLLAIQNEMNRLFGRTFAGGSATVVGGDDPSVAAPAPEGSWAPAVDVFETAQKLHVLVELPGLSASDVEITVDDSVLTLKGERPFYPGQSEDAFHRIERRFGPFRRRITLPKQSDTDRISASMDEGVLTIEVPKIEQAQPRKIEVKASQS